MKKIAVFLLLMVPRFIFAAEPFIINGLEGDELANVQLRLKGFSNDGAMVDVSALILKNQIREALYPYGFFSPKIQLETLNDKTLKIWIDKGPQTRIKKLDLKIIGEGRENLVLLKALADFPLKVGEPFNSMLYEKAKNVLVLEAEKEGFLHASYDKAKVFINKKEATADIELVFNTCYRFYFGAIHFNQSLVKEELLQRFAPFKFGQPYSNKSLLAFNHALSQSGYFGDVLVLPQIGTNPTVPIDVNLTPLPRKTYAIGLGFGTDTGPRGRFDFRMSPVNRYGHQFSASVLGSLKENRFQVDYSIPGSYPLTDRYNLMSSFSTLNYTSGYANSLLVSGAARHLGANTQRVLSLNQLFEEFNYDGLPWQTVHAFFPKATLDWIHRKEGLFSPSGYHFNLMGTAANRSFLSNLSFAQMAFDGRAALTLDGIRTRFYIHTLLGYTHVDDVYQFPLSLALLLGGADNMKAFSLNAIGPGRKTAYFGFEIQKETWDKWYLTGFIDRGAVFDPLPKNNLTDMGLGFMWVSPIGPIKVGFAQIVDKQNHWQWKKDGWRLVINMGPDL